MTAKLKEALFASAGNVTGGSMLHTTCVMEKLFGRKDIVRGNMKNLWKWFFVTFTLVMCLDILFDTGKWALGRYTEVLPWLSILVIVGFSALLSGMVEMIHYLRRKEERHYEQYLHHKVKVWVTGKQKGEHWESSLCPGCEFFSPDTPGNCLIESVVHTTSRDNHLVLVVWECPKFKRRVE